MNSSAASFERPSSSRTASQNLPGLQAIRVHAASLCEVARLLEIFQGRAVVADSARPEGPGNRPPGNGSRRVPRRESSASGSENLPRFGKAASSMKIQARESPCPLLRSAALRPIAGDALLQPDCRFIVTLFPLSLHARVPRSALALAVEPLSEIDHVAGILGFRESAETSPCH